MNSQGPLCHSLTVVDDGISENRESFLIIVTSAMNYIIVPNAPAQVLIIDDDC